MSPRAAHDQNRLTTSMLSQHRGKSLAVAGGLVLVLSGLGGCVGSQTDTPTSTTSTSSSPQSPTSSAPKSSAPAHELLDEFDGWKKGEVTDIAGHQSAVYSKGEQELTLLVMDGSEAQSPQAAWDKTEKFGEITCQAQAALVACVGEKDSQVILGNAVSEMSTEEVAEAITAYLDAL